MNTILSIDGPPARPPPLRLVNAGSLAPATSCIVKRYSATRTDGLPWMFYPSAKPFTRQVVNYIVCLTGEKAKLGRVWRTCSGIHAPFLPCGPGKICGPCKITVTTVIPSTRPTTHALPGIYSMAFDDRVASHSTSCGGLTEIG